MTLVPITGRDESLRAFKAFQSAFSIGADVIQGCRPGWQGGNVEADVYWHETIRVWGVFRKEPPQPRHKGRNRFWNCFGVSQPRFGKMLNITVEINPPHEDENLRTGGVFLRDEEGRLYVGHSGKIGGGRRGIGRQAFQKFSNRLPWQEITTPKGSREVMIFGPLDAGGFPDMLAQFVHTVAELKDAIIKTPTGRY